MWKQFTILLGMALPAGFAYGAVRGLYSSDCLSIETFSATKDLLFKEQTLETVQTFYADRSCRAPTYDISFSGPYALNLKISAVNYRYNHIKLRVLDASLLEAFNHQAICGFSDWTLNTEREISGRQCAGQAFPKAGTLIYDAVVEDAKTGGIHMGLGDDLHDGSTSEARPTELDPLIFQPK